MQKLIALSFFLLWSLFSYGQKDTIKQISTVTISTGKRNRFKSNLTQPAGTIEQEMKKDTRIDFIQRGAFGSEILLNGMGSDRSIVTIDGMRIHSACTDKMDPTTSYLDINNIDGINTQSSGLNNAYGNSIAGNVNLQSKKPSFGAKKIQGNLTSGISSNNGHTATNASLDIVRPKFYLQPTISFRKAWDYKDGDNERVNYSGFTKYNASTKMGVKLNEKTHLETFAIFDEAQNVGFPALPMDVKLARMFLISQGVTWLKHECEKEKIAFHSKVYFNRSEHIMDDSQRSNVPIRMDMPGFSNTAGYLIDFERKFNEKHYLTLNLNGHWNQSKAEMTMYPADGKPDMYMYTWPNIQTINNRLNANYSYSYKGNQTILINASIQQQHYSFGDSMGYHTTTIFHPDVNWSQTRINKSLSLEWNYGKEKPYFLSIAAAYSDRAPTISEAYGFYLFNSYDRFDYIGDPNLKNEKSLFAEIKWRRTFGKNHKHRLSASANYFHIIDYIYGRILPDISQMTIGASGVKQYEQLDFANQVNALVAYSYTPVKWYTLDAAVQYSYGKGKGNLVLPFIAPIRLQLGNTLKLRRSYVEVRINYHARQYAFGSYFGEIETSSWYTLDLAYKRTFMLKKSQTLDLIVRAENVTNQYYTTYSDWNKIPRMGRNFNLQISYNF